jgi:hypothetical protein
MIRHPDEVAVFNRQSRKSLEKLAYPHHDLDTFERSAGELKAELGATDFHELDWFLFLVGKGAIAVSPLFMDAERQVAHSRLSQAGYFTLPEEVPEVPGLTEGAVSTIQVNAYERNPEARRTCIEHYGPTCVVCGFDFGRVYGQEAQGYIHVHHLKQLSEVGEEYEVDPVADLRPVCPNCHAVIHLGGGCRSIEAVKQMLQQGRATVQ